MNRYSFPSRFLLSTCLTACAIAAASPLLFANAAQTIFPGESAMEVDPGLSGLRIEHEDLVIDLRRVADSGWGVVEARYYLLNRGERRRVSLRFVLGSDLYATTRGDGGGPAPRAFEAWIDDWGIGEVSYDSMIAPPEWMPPPMTPAIDDEGAHDYESELAFGVRSSGIGEFVDWVRTLSFSVEIDTGLHELRVRYRTRPALATDYLPAQLWQLGYVLAPARRWDSFGTLSMTVIVPREWLAASSPVMERRGDTLHATWQGLPSNALGITLRHPISRWYASLPEIVGGVFGLAVLVAGIIVMRRTTRFHSANPRRDLLLGPFVSTTASGLVALAMHFGWSLGDDLWREAAGDQKPDLYLHGCLWYVVAIPAVGLGALVYLVRLARRSNSAPPNDLNDVAEPPQT